MKLLKGLGVCAALFFGAQQAGAEEIILKTNTVLNHNNLSYVPTKMVTDQLRIPVSWDNQAKSLTIQKDHQTILFKMGEPQAKVNGQTVKTPPIVVKDGVSYLPLRFIGENLHMKVDWNRDVITLTTFDKYIVQEGDYLYKISKKVGMSVEEIQKINNLKDDKLQIGQVLYLKADLALSNSTYITETNSLKEESDKKENEKKNSSSNSSSEQKGKGSLTESKNKMKDDTFEYTTYIVKKGDYLSKISAEQKVSLKDLLAVNNLTENSILQIGDQLLLPKRVIPTKEKVSEKHGEYLDWWTEAQYVFPIGEIATVIDFETGVSFQIRRSYGANHADCEPLTAEDTRKAKELWGGFSWNTRAVLVQVGDRTIAASMSFMPHDIESILDNDFEGHFDLHFKNSTRHKDGKIDQYHQEKIKIAAGVVDK